MTDSLFSYKYGTTIIHKIPALIKLIILCFVSIRVFSQQTETTDVNNWIQLLFYFFIDCIFYILAKIKFSSIKKLLFIPILCFGIIILQCIDFEKIISINFLQIQNTLLYTTKLFITSLLALIIFETTSIYQIENDLDKIHLFKKLKISQTISLTILFIPMIFRTWKKIQIATKARNPNKKNSIGTKLFFLFQNLTTLLSCILNSAENTRKTILNRVDYN